MEAAFVTYLLLLLATAWFTAYTRHLALTAQVIEEKLAPTLPEETTLQVPVPLYARKGIAENLALLLAIGFGVINLDWPWVLGGFAAFLFIFLPLCVAYLAPRPGAWHYYRYLRAQLEEKLAAKELAGNKEEAVLLRIAIERLDKGL